MKKQKWTAFDEPLTLEEVELELDLPYGDKVQLKTTCHRVINAIYDFTASWVNGGWAGSDDYFKINESDANFLKNKKIITHYRETK
jgi:hypothetical protein